ncbi:MAG: hypothetical protein MRY74_10830 [Neomegalonema sp.]|nr:hypothetical protein [Neomegalonema sp.]
MAYVKLPEELRMWEVLLPDGGASRFEFSIFAGEVLRVETRSEPSHSGATTLYIRSQRGERRFDFSHLPVQFKQGDVVGVLAVLPETEDDGPILCVANLDSDQRIDFLSREPELLRLMTNDAVDLRRAALGWGDIAGALFRGALLGGVAAVGAAIVKTLLAAASGAIGGGALAMAARVGATLFQDPSCLVIGASAGVGGFGVLMTLATLRLSRQGRFQRELLDHVWRRAGEALGFVQDNIDAFRFSSIVVGAGGSAPSEPRPVEGEEVTRDRPLRPIRGAAEDAQLAPPAASGEPRGDKAARPSVRAARRVAPRIPNSVKQAQAERARWEEELRRREQEQRQRSEPAPRRHAEPAPQMRAELSGGARSGLRPADADRARSVRTPCAHPRRETATRHVAAARARLDRSDAEADLFSARLDRMGERLTGGRGGSVDNR